jgi:hypothetical protein
MKLLCVAVLSVIFSSAVRADNFSGKWVIETSDRGGQGQAQALRLFLQLNQTGKGVTGTVTVSRNDDPGSASPVNNEIFDGKADGDTISFYVWKGTDQPWKEHFLGKVSGGDIIFTISDDHARTQATGSANSAEAKGQPRMETAKRTQ